MAKNKKIKLSLGLIGISGLIVAPTSLVLVGCSETPDEIQYYQKAEGGFFFKQDGQRLEMSAEETPFLCDFNLTKKICSIVEWDDLYPNAYIDIGSEKNDNQSSNKKNAIRLPSIIKYNGEEFKVIGFSSLKGIPEYKKKVLDLSVYNLVNSAQVIEFDSNFEYLKPTDELLDTNVPLDLGLIRSPKSKMLKIFNVPNIKIDLSFLPNLVEVTFNEKAQFKSIPILKDNKSLEFVKIPDSVTDILNFTFENCTSLSNVEFPKNLKYIGFRVFYGTKINWNTIPNYIYKNLIPEGLFFTLDMTNFTFPDTITKIESFAFSESKNLGSITIPSNVIIDYNAFSNSVNLTSVTIKEGVVVGIKAFANNKNLTTVVIEDGVKSIYKWAFSNCTSLESVRIPSSIKIIDEFLFDSCSNLSTVTIENGITSIGDSAFSGCTSLESIHIPSSIKSIGDSAFSDCTNLRNVTFENGITSIGDSAFSDCSSLESITIPDNVSYIGDSVFYGCYNLKSVTFPDSVERFGQGIFSSISNHPPGFKIKFYSEKTRDLFLQTNPEEADYCEVINSPQN